MLNAVFAVHCIFVSAVCVPDKSLAWNIPFVTYLSNTTFYIHMMSRMAWYGT